MFMIATIQRMVSGTPTHSGSVCTPSTGKVKRCTQIPKPVAIAAAAIWPAIRRVRYTQHQIGADRDRVRSVVDETGQTWRNVAISTGSSTTISCRIPARAVAARPAA